MSDQSGERIRREIEAVWRIEAPRLIATLTRLTQDVGIAEELAGDALVVALERWPIEGVPERPGAWLLTIARRRGIDQIRRRENLASKYQLIGQALSDQRAERDLVELVDHIEDDTLRLAFIACHPAIPVEQRVALCLRLLGGLSVPEIAAAFLVSEAAMAARITRAKKGLRTARASFDLPVGPERDARLPDVLEVIYLVFNEGYSATAGDHWMRPYLCEEAVRLGRVLARQLPNESEVHGLLALMQLQASRTPARTAPDGTPILLLDQDRRRWDRSLIQSGLASLRRATQQPMRVGPYTLQAAIAACHAQAQRASDTDWARIVSYYDLLLVATPSPVVALNRAVAVGQASGAQAGLAALESLQDSDLEHYYLFHATRAHFHVQLNSKSEAAAALRDALRLVANDAERSILQQRLDALG